MSHSNISIFVPHLGCPNKCSFCNQNSITGAQKAPTTKEVYDTCKNAFDKISDKQNTEIAFFGGSFTAINRKYMIELLETVQEFIGLDKFKGIRISTRPDCIDEEVLKLLDYYHVTAIELGVQSMNDDVLYANDRGHSSYDVRKACALIKKYNFELGLQMMVGLYQSTPDMDYYTAEQIVGLKPSTVRVYPVVIMEDTRLGELYKMGKYIPYSLETAVEVCCRLIELFDKNNIRIIKLGLHASEVVEETLLGGLYHPAFKELCENKIFYDNILNELKKLNDKTVVYDIYVPVRSLSKSIGQNKCNLLRLKKSGYNVKFKEDSNLYGYQVRIGKEEHSCT